MAEALGIAGSVVSFVGLSGQILQGCHHVRTLIDDIRDASGDLQALRTEVGLFERAMIGFNSTLRDATTAGRVGLNDPTQALKLALDYGDMTVKKLKAIVDKHSKHGNKIWWKNVSAALRKDKVQKHLARLQRARGYIDSIHSNMLMVIQLDQTSCLTSLKSDQAASLPFITGTQVAVETIRNIQLADRGRTQNISTAISDFRTDYDNSKALITETHGAMENIKEVSSGMQEGIERLNVRTISQYAKSQMMMEESMAAMSSEHAMIQGSFRSFQGETRAAIRSLQTDLSRISESQTVLISRVIESTIQDVLDREVCHSELSAKRRSDESPDKSVPYQLRKSTSHQCPPLDANAMSSSLEADVIEVFKSSKPTIHQTQRTRTYHTWIGDVTVVSIIHEMWAQNAALGENERMLSSSSTLVKITICPNGYFLKKGVSSEIQRTTPKFGQASLSVTNLRIWNIVSQSSPIIQACSNGDFKKVYMLFSTRQASPFDRCEVLTDKGFYFEENNASLLNIAFSEFDKLIKGQSMPDMSLPGSSDTRVYESAQAFLKLIRLLVNCGLDPGEGHIGGKFITEGIWYEVFRVADVQSTLAQVFRIIIEESKTSPFDKFECIEAGLLQSLGKGPQTSACIQIIEQQDRWHISWPDMYLKDAWPEQNRFRGALFGWCCWYMDGDIDLLLSHLNSIGQTRDMTYLACTLLEMADVLGDEAIDDRIYGPYFGKIGKGIQHYIGSLLEIGLDPQASFDICFSKTSFNITQFAEECNQLDIWCKYLRRTGWSQSEIEDLVEEYRYMSLAYQLFYLEDNDPFLGEFKYIPLVVSLWDEYLESLSTFAWGKSYGIGPDETGSFPGDVSRDSISESGSTDETGSHHRIKLDSNNQLSKSTTLAIQVHNLHLFGWFPSVVYVFGLFEASRSREAGSIYTDFSWRLPMTAPTKSSDLVASTLQSVEIVRRHRDYFDHNLNGGWSDYYDDLSSYDIIVPSEINEIRDPVSAPYEHQSRYQPRRLRFWRSRAFGSIYLDSDWRVAKVLRDHLPFAALIARRLIRYSDYGEWECPSK